MSPYFVNGKKCIMCLFAPKKVHKNNCLSKGGGGKIKCRFFVNIKYICEQWDMRNDDKGEAVEKQWRSTGEGSNGEQVLYLQKTAGKFKPVP